MNLEQAPFKVVAGQLPESVGADMVAAFAEISALPDRTRAVFGTLMDMLGVKPSHPVHAAGARLATDIDCGGGGGHPHPYHNTRHFCEVMLSSHYIAQLQKLHVEACAEVVLAALMHDYGHDVRPDGVPFRLERQSVTMAFEAFGDEPFSPGQRQRIAALVLSTAVARGHPVAIACNVGHETHNGWPAIPSEAPELAVLVSDPLAARQALVLCEADVLPSVGLTFGHALKMQAELSAEWDTQLDARDKLRFIDDWFKRSTMSVYFKPNVEALRHGLWQQLKREASAARPAAEPAAKPVAAPKLLPGTKAADDSKADAPVAALPAPPGERSSRLLMLGSPRAATDGR
ncbi:hypothetical protein BH09PSE5_BH09PSE5_02020 [soil metagenome]